MDIISCSQPQLRTNTESTLISSSKDRVFKVHKPCIYLFFLTFAYLFCVQGMSKDNLQVLACSFNYEVLVVELRSLGLAISLPQHLHEVT